MIFTVPVIGPDNKQMKELSVCHTISIGQAGTMGKCSASLAVLTVVAPTPFDFTSIIMLML